MSPLATTRAEVQAAANSLLQRLEAHGWPIGSFKDERIEVDTGGGKRLYLRLVGYLCETGEGDFGAVKAAQDAYREDKP